MDEPIVVGGAPEERSRRIIVLVGLAAALILAVVVLPGMLFGGGGTTPEPLPPIVSGSAPTTVPGEAPPETFEAFSDKNPFTPLVAAGPVAEETAPPPAEEAAAPSASAEGDASGEPIVIDDGAEAPAAEAGAPSDGEGAPVAPAPQQPARQPDRVSLLEVFIDPSGRTIASIRVNDVMHQVAEGDEFASSYRVLDLDSSTRCAEVLFGDDRFVLCEGQEALK